MSKTKFDNLNEENFINNNIFFEYYKKVVNDYKNFKKRIDCLDLKKIFQKNKEYEFFLFN